MVKKKSVVTLSKKVTTARVSVKASGSCQMFATFDMQCPVCHVVVPANTPHSCGSNAEGSR